MKRYILVVLILVATLAMVSGFLWRNRKVQAVSVQINVKDIPKDGLVIIGPSDPSFNVKVSALLKGKPNIIVEALKPFSVLLKNTGKRAVVAYQLKWEMVQADGSINSRETGGVNPGALMDGGPSDLENLSISGGYAIKPNSIQFVSLMMSLGEDQGGTIGAFASGSSDPSKIAEFQQAARDKNLTTMLDNIIAELQSYTSITVSVDGAFFEDGVFVGPDTTGFFAKVEAGIDANRDLLEEIAFAIKHNRKQEEIFSDMEDWANRPIGRFVTTADYYNYYKKMYADEILHMKKAMGGDKAIAMALQPLRKPWPKLKKQ